MSRTMIAAMSLAAVLTLPSRQAAAQDNVIGGALLGGAAGAIIGGAAAGNTGGAAAGAIIGAATGAIIGAQMEPRRNGYYWYEGRCWYRYPSGQYRSVSYRRCR